MAKPPPKTKVPARANKIPKLVVLEASFSGEWRVAFKSGNGTVLMTSEGVYKTRALAARAARSIAQQLPGATLALD